MGLNTVSQMQSPMANVKKHLRQDVLSYPVPSIPHMDKTEMVISQLLIEIEP